MVQQFPNAMPKGGRMRELRLGAEVEAALHVPWFAPLTRLEGRQMLPFWK
jgi:hypothetical protein